jgi:hypothetical protein|tara:strand:+ start:37 stop:228 length:192 start_codon:yes stop_codon:yes gene_type:complete
MFKNVASIVIKIKGNIEIIPKIKNNLKTQTTKNKPKYNKKIVPDSLIECDDEYIKKIIKNGGL